jgi:hypothetical protein
MSEMHVTAADREKAMAVEMSRLYEENITLRAAIIRLQQEKILDDEIKIGGTD